MTRVSKGFRVCSVSAVACSSGTRELTTASQEDRRTRIGAMYSSLILPCIKRAKPCGAPPSPWLVGSFMSVKVGHRATSGPPFPLGGPVIIPLEKLQVSYYSVSALGEGLSGEARVH